LVAKDLATWTHCVYLTHYIDGILLTSHSYAELEAAVVALQLALSQWDWVVNEAKVQRPGYFVKFLGVVWLGKTQVIPDAITDRVQALPIP
jgi:hypothetical protein